MFKKKIYTVRREDVHRPQLKVEKEYGQKPSIYNIYIPGNLICLKKADHILEMAELI